MFKSQNNVAKRTLNDQSDILYNISYLTKIYNVEFSAFLVPVWMHIYIQYFTSQITFVRHDW